LCILGVHPDRATSNQEMSGTLGVPHVPNDLVLQNGNSSSSEAAGAATEAGAAGAAAGLGGSCAAGEAALISRLTCTIGLRYTFLVVLLTRRSTFTRSP